MKTSYQPLADNDMLALLEDEPELLAVADAIATTQQPGAWSAHRTPLRRLLWLAAAVVGALLGLVALNVAGVKKASLSSRALAALGNDDVLYARVMKLSSTTKWVDLATGKQTSPATTTEVWFDQSRGLLATVVSQGGRTIDKTLVTPTGGWTQTGPIYTCDWVRAHPESADRVGISCGSPPGDASDSAARAYPIDPALRDFLDNYRTALSSGAAVVDGHDVRSGRTITWLRFTTRAAYTERVGIDSASLKPVIVEARSLSGASEYAVDAIDTIPFATPLFTRPAHVAEKNQQIRLERVPVSDIRTAASDLPLLWAGESWRDLVFSGAFRVRWAVRVGAKTQRAVSIELDYRQGGSAARTSTVQIFESGSCLGALGWSCTSIDPPAGVVSLGGPVDTAQIGNVYLTFVHSSGAASTGLELARALVPVER